jgi:predicted transcriptional regulator
MADLLDRIRTEIDARLSELRPIAEEAANLQAALTALDAARPAAGASRPAQRERSGPAGRGRRATPRGQTRERIIEHVRANPGSTAGEVARALGLRRTSVATRLAQLAKSGELTKAARGYAAP